MTTANGLAPNQNKDQSNDRTRLMFRIIAGGIMIPHGLSELVGGSNSIAGATLSQVGVSPSSNMSYLIVFLELVGGIGVLSGFFTRVFASALAAEMLWAASVFWSQQSGIGVTREYAPWGFPLLLGCLMLVVAAGGGGRWSVDRVLGHSN